MVLKPIVHDAAASAFDESTTALNDAAANIDHPLSAITLGLSQFSTGPMFSQNS